MNKFRGQYMDMVHPSSDVKVSDKPNHADQKPNKVPALVAPPPEPEETSPDVVDDNAYESPFLPDVEVEKRPLGGIENTRQLFGIDDAKSTFDIDDFVDLSKPELPADDGGKGELEPELPSGEELELEESGSAPEEEEPEIKTETSKMINTMIQPQYKTDNRPVDKPIKPVAPFAHAAEPVAKPKIKKTSSILAYIALFVLIAIAGAAIGALIYLSGWLG